MIKTKHFRAFYEADGTGAGSAAPVAPVAPATDPAAPAAPAGTPPATPAADEKIFTQEQVNDFVAKGTAKEIEKLAKDLGVSDVKGLKDAAKKLKEYQDSQKTEAEKNAEALRVAAAEKETLSTENATLKAQLAAFQLGVKSDQLEKVVKLAGTYEGETVEDKIKAVIKDFPSFVAATPQGGVVAFGGPSGGAPSDANAAALAAAKAAMGNA